MIDKYKPKNFYSVKQLENKKGNIIWIIKRNRKTFKFRWKKKEQKYVDYKQYIKSKRWKKLSKLIKTIKPTCENCNKYPSLHTHHKTYDNIGNEKYTDLLALCKACHCRIHGIKINTR